MKRVSTKYIGSPKLYLSVYFVFIGSKIDVVGLKGTKKHQQPKNKNEEIRILMYK